MAGKFRCNWAWLSLLWFISVSVFAIQEDDWKSIVMASEKNSAQHKQARRKLDDVDGEYFLSLTALNLHENPNTNCSDANFSG